MIYVLVYMSNFTFLTKCQIMGQNQLNFFRKYGTRCVATDFAILLGCSVQSYYFKSEEKMKKYKVGTWWTKSADGMGDAFVIEECGRIDNRFVDSKCIGGRPALPYSSIKFSSKTVRINNEIKEVEYGEYPQTVVDEDYSRELENAYNNGSLITTDKDYVNFSAYVYDGIKYIRFVGDQNCAGERLSDDREIRVGTAYWVRVEPIIWMIDEIKNVALAKKILFSGVQFNRYNNYNAEGDFNKTNIKMFMDNYFSKEIEPSKTYSQTSSVDQNSSLEQTPTFDQNTSVKQTQDLEENNTVRKQNPYDFNFDEVSEEDIIKWAVESNVSVFLHGRSSDGKSARVKQLDPDCEIIYMSNATPDSLNGKSVYNAVTGEMIDVPPTWYKKVKEKCEAEPNKIHIIFFDELTNALPSIQGMAFNIVLEGEVNGKWKLPSNARIVAAGNDMEDSLAANQMAEPMFNRFAHVYINTTVDSWLKWASTPKEKYERLDYKEEETQATIHPAIYAYVAYKSYNFVNVLRTPYTGDKPNADPRKWEMASKVLYKTKQPEMLRALIGEDLTRDFTAFVSQQVISVEDVINHNYSSRDLEMDISQKYATAVGLSSVSDEHFEIVRDFMKQVGAEPTAVFESIWTHGDEKRLEHLLEVQMTDGLSQGGMKR